MKYLIEPDVLDSMQLTVNGRTYTYSPEPGYNFVDARGQLVPTEQVPTLFRQIVEHRLYLFFKIPIDDLAEWLGRCETCSERLQGYP